MRNARTLLERTVLSKSIEGELRTFDIDLHETDAGYVMYVYDPEEAFETGTFTFAGYESAKAAFDGCVEILMREEVRDTDTPFDFAERVLEKITLQTGVTPT